MKNNAKTGFFKSRLAALRKSSYILLQRQNNETILKFVDISNWTNYLIIIPKSNGNEFGAIIKKEQMLKRNEKNNML